MKQSSSGIKILVFKAHGLQFSTRQNFELVLKFMLTFTVKFV